MDAFRALERDPAFGELRVRRGQFDPADEAPVLRVEPHLDRRAGHEALDGRDNRTRAPPEVDALHEDVLRVVDMDDHLVPELLRALPRGDGLEPRAPRHRLRLHAAERIERADGTQHAGLEVRQLGDRPVGGIRHLLHGDGPPLVVLARLEAEDVVVEPEAVAPPLEVDEARVVAARLRGVVHDVALVLPRPHGRLRHRVADSLRTARRRERDNANPIYRT